MRGQGEADPTSTWTLKPVDVSPTLLLSGSAEPPGKGAQTAQSSNTATVSDLPQWHPQAAAVAWRARVSLTLRLICGYLLRSLLPFLTFLLWNNGGVAAGGG